MGNPAPMRLRDLVVLGLWLSLAGLGMAAASPGGVELFIRNRPLEGEVRVLGGEVYAPLEDLLRALELSWAPEGDRLMVWSRPGGGPSLPAEPRVLVLDGQVLLVPQEPFAGRLYIPVADFARVTGARYNWNRELGTADFFPAASVAAGGGVGRRPTDGRGSNGSPLRLVALSHALAAPPGASHPVLRGYAVVRNAGTVPLEDLVLKVEIRDEAGAVRGGFTWQAGRLPAGQELTWQFPLWTDFENAADPHPVMLFEHRPVGVGGGQPPP